MSSDWITHNGTHVPNYPPRTYVYVQFADGTDDLGEDPWTVELWGINWVHSDPQHPNDIVAYKLVDNDE